MLRMTMAALCLGVVAIAGGCADPDEPMSARYAEIVPTVYMNDMNNGCALLRLSEDVDDASTKSVDGGRLALAVCARVETDEWVVVDGVLDVENVEGEARVLPIPPDNASAFADAPASLEALAVGHVRVTATFGDMTGSGWIEIVEQ